MTSEMLLQTWFKKSIQPSNTMLWVSAVAPDTFQADPRILEKLLKRPLEIPDAMGQQRAIARFSGCLIARAIKEMNLTPIQLTSMLHEFNFFHNPDILLHKPLPEALQTYLQKLIREAFDPTNFWEYELRTLSQHFREGVHVLRTLFKVKRNQKPIPKLTSFFATEHEWWGTNYHREACIVNVHPPFLFLPAVSKCLVLRDAVRIFLPTSFQEAFDVQEFANILVSKLLEQSERQLWSQIKWNGTQPTSEQQQWISRISETTPKLIEKNCLPSLYSRLNRVDSLASRVPTGAFTLLTQQELSAVTPQLIITKIQQQILLNLMKTPMASERQLAKANQLARGTVSRNLLNLKDQFGIKVLGELNYHRIGLSPLLLKVDSCLNSKASVLKIFDLSQQLNTFPYCFRLHGPTSLTNTTLYAVLALPDSSISEFQHFLKEWKKSTESSLQVFWIKHFEWGWNFSYGENFLPAEWKIIASSDLRLSGSESSVSNIIRYENHPIKLTREGLRVLLILQNDPRISQRQLANDAQTSVTTAANHYNRLIPDIITPYVSFAKPAFPEGMITLVNCSSKDACEQLLRGIRLLPSFHIWHLASLLTEDPTTLLISVNLPQGGLIPFNTAFHEVTSYYETIPSSPLIASRQLPQIHELPIALFKTSGQEWMCSSSLLESLFSLTSK